MWKSAVRSSAIWGITYAYPLAHSVTAKPPLATVKRTLKGLSQITPGSRTASKYGYIGHFRTAPGRLPSDFTGAGTILTRTGAGVSKTLLPILPAFYSNR